MLGIICNDLGGSGAIPPAAEIRTAAERHLARWQGHRLVHPSLAISIPEAASDDMLHTVSRLAAEAGAIFQTHVNEHLVAVERSLVARGLRPLEHLHAVGALGPQTLIAHATLVTPFELNILRDSTAPRRSCARPRPSASWSAKPSRSSSSRSPAGSAPTTSQAALLLIRAVFAGSAASRLAHDLVGGRTLRIGVLVFPIVTGALLMLR